MRGRGADRGRLDPFELPRVRSSWAAAGWRWRRSPAQPLPRPPASSWAWPVQAADGEWRRRPGHASAPVASSRAEGRGGTGVHVGRESGQECSRQPGLDSRRPFGACGTGELGRRSDADSDTRRRWVRLRLGTRKTHACKGGGPTPALLGRGPGKIPVFHVERGRLGLPGFPREAEVRELEPQRGALRRRRRRREARARRRAVRARLAGAELRAEGCPSQSRRVSALLWRVPDARLLAGVRARPGRHGPPSLRRRRRRGGGARRLERGPRAQRPRIVLMPEARSPAGIPGRSRCSTWNTEGPGPPRTFHVEQGPGGPGAGRFHVERGCQIDRADSRRPRRENTCRSLRRSGGCPPG